MYGALGFRVWDFRFYMVLRFWIIRSGFRGLGSVCRAVSGLHSCPIVETTSANNTPRILKTETPRTQNQIAYHEHSFSNLTLQPKTQQPTLQLTLRFQDLGRAKPFQHHFRHSALPRPALGGSFQGSVNELLSTLINPHQEVITHKAAIYPKSQTCARGTRSLLANSLR